MRRPEIQALRALAVALVLAYHLWPASVPGGFVGVDVFFVISGFLITDLLLRELDRSTTISLAKFWARRARRILPAALLMLLVCGVATIALVPQTYWPQYMAEIRASGAYVQNWHLAGAAVDYMAASDAPSPVQHYWSLSAEEQFYLVWPVLLGIAAWLAHRARPMRRNVALVAAMAAFTGISLAYSLYDTATNTASAYFVTPTRAWEFGLGGLLALYPPRSARGARHDALLAWIGIVGILVASLTFSDRTPFPGYAALLPVLGAMAVIRAGTPEGAWALTPLLRLPPVQFTGDISYSVYLWHWPLIALAPFALGHRPGTIAQVAIVGITLVAAWTTKVAVEDPIRVGGLLVSRRPAWTFAAAAAATAIVMSVPVEGTSEVRAQVRKDERVSTRILAAHPRCFGAAARDPHRRCDNRRLRFSVVPTPLQARSTSNAPCRVTARSGLVQVCEFGVSRRRAAATIALLGDSHASQWRAALAIVARTERWRGLSITHTSCPLQMAIPNLSEPQRSQCIRWRRDALRWLARHRSITTIFVAAHSGEQPLVARGQSALAAHVAAYTRTWTSLPGSVRHIVVIRDTPSGAASLLPCVQRAMSRHRRAGVACTWRRREALPRDPAVATARRLATPRVVVADLTPFLCSRRLCPAVIGGALVYKDPTHMTRVFAGTLGPYLRREVDRLIGSASARRG